MTTPHKSDIKSKIWGFDTREEFFLYGLTPVMFLAREDGRRVVKAFDVDRLEFEIDNSLWAEIWHDRSNLVQKVTQAEFVKTIQNYGISVEIIDAAMKT